MNYKCGHCGYIGPCYGTPFVGKTTGISAPWCKRCGMNDMLKIYNHTLELTEEDRGISERPE